MKIPDLYTYLSEFLSPAINPLRLEKGANKDYYLGLDWAEAAALYPKLAEDGFGLIGLFGLEGFRGYEGLSLLYVFEKRNYSGTLVIIRRTDSPVASIAAIFPSACYFEREIRDGYGCEFENAFDRRRLWLHETYPANFHPLVKSFKNQPLSLPAGVEDEALYPFKKVSGDGVYEVGVGPVHAGIIEPGHFRFSAIGEPVLNLEIRLFYKHRGLEKLAVGRDIDFGLKIAESVSGDESAANTYAYSLAVEHICSVRPPRRAEQLRLILLEMERLYSHLSDLSGMLTDVAYPVGAAALMALREELMRWNKRLSGSRFLKGIITPGGLLRDIPAGIVNELADYLRVFEGRFNQQVEKALAKTSVVDRFETTGIINNRLLVPLNITGVAARASGADIDTRLNQPYGLYSELAFEPPVLPEGDVMARFKVRVSEVQTSLGLILQTASRLSAGEYIVPLKPQNGYSLVLVESPRGQSLHWLWLRDGKIERYKVRTASYCNWQAIEHAVLGDIIPDFPLINKSLNLSYAGTDL
ncbi:MAG: NADH-quinone oxidoreductase subunit C [Dehalococcoides mccartyi]|uniref:hydrogenase large subunit n=1 Tax=Dehalococcoides mccartyi TaxID=61435 RepID=UPI0030F6C01C